MFDEKSLNTLEYGKILSLAAAYTQSEGGRRDMLALVPCSTLAAASRELSLTAEADRVLFEFSVSPSFAIDDIDEVLQKAEKGAVLSIGELLRAGRVLRVADRLSAALKKVTGIPLLSEMSLGLHADRDLEKRISDAFLSDTEVADGASHELKEIRRRIRRIGERVKASLQSFVGSQQYRKYLQDSIVTVRGDRYVIPVKSEFKGMIPGLVHDQSASGATLYVEPFVVVNLNNELKTEHMAEEAEIEKILRGFSSEVASAAHALATSCDIITAMDVVFAKAQYARATKAVRPELSSRGALMVREGRHPLLDPAKAVPLTLEMLPGDKMLLITGPNTGGKTVTLKMAGLFVLLALSGFYLPAKSAEIPLVDGVYSDIGDEQSIEQSLSTFSAHIKNISGILTRLTEHSLVLFDELGAGTDPGEGAALAVAVSEFVMSTGAKAIVTSHFNDLKEFALTAPGVVTACMEFDTATFRPTFRLVMGAIGTSNALDIATNLGLDPAIIERARSRISPEKKKFDSVLSAAEQTRRRAEQLVTDASKDREKAASELKEAEDKKREIEEKREKLNDAIRKRTKDLIEDSVAEADGIIEELKALLEKPEVTDGDLFAARTLRRKLEKLSAHYDSESVVEDEPDLSAPLAVGDDVWIKSVGKRGTLVSLSPRGEAVVSLGRITVKVKKGDYYRVGGKK